MNSKKLSNSRKNNSEWEKSLKKYKLLNIICKGLAYLYSYFAIGYTFFSYGYNVAMVKCGLDSAPAETSFLFLIPSVAVILILGLLSRNFGRKFENGVEEEIIK